MDNRFKQFSKGVKQNSCLKNKGVVYTRVSTKGQAENNASLDTQMKYCEKYAIEKKIELVDFFGGTYESAKNDERAEFQKMLTFVKKRKDIGFIIVYSYDRFSRSGPGGAFISHELKQKGIHVVSATQSVDYSDPSGNFMEGIYHLFSQFDNQLRRDKSMTGMIEKLKQGYWPFIPPMGYDNLNIGSTADQHKLEINAKGLLIKKAFEWKAKKNLSLVEIANKLSARGWDVQPKRLTEYFRNPFYCGYIVSKMIPGELINGKQPILVSKKTFLLVHENLAQHNSGYHIQSESEELPLKQFIKCDSCGTSFTGYLVKAKGLYYYKCNQKGCKKNRSQKVLHRKFKKLIESFEIDSKLVPVLQKMLSHILSEKLKSDPANLKYLKGERTKLISKIENIEERFVNGDIEENLYQKFTSKYTVKVEQLSKEISNSEKSVSNIEKAVDKCIQIAQKLPTLWENASYSKKRRLQYLLFPDGVFYNREKDDYRTLRINLLFSVIPELVGCVEGNKKGDSVISDKIPDWVVPPGLEPGTF